MTRYDTNSKLLGKIQTGKGDEELYEGWKYIFIDAIFGGTKPENIKQETNRIDKPNRNTHFVETASIPTTNVGT